MVDGLATDSSAGLSSASGSGPGAVLLLLVDRITTGTPARDVRAALEQRLGYADALLTVTEPQALWAIEADPAELRAAFGIDVFPSR